MKSPNGSALVPPGGTIVEAQDLVFSFGETPALRDASLSVQRWRDRGRHGPERIGQVHAAPLPRRHPRSRSPVA